MLRRSFRFLAAAIVSLFLAAPTFADEVMGKITKVGEEGREITIEQKGGKEVTVKISGSRTKLDGVKSRGDLKEGQNVTVEHEKGEASKVKVTKTK
jgi:hypothetical protein